MKAKCHDLKAEKPKYTTMIKDARFELKRSRKQLRSNYKTCRKTLKKNRDFSDESCEHFRTDNPYENKAQSWLIEMKAGQEHQALVQQYQMKKSKEEKMDKKSKKEMRKLLRSQRREAKDRIKAKFRDVRSVVRRFRKKLRSACFQYKVLPEIIRMLKPQLDQSLAKMDLNNYAGEAGNKCAKGAPSQDISVGAVLREYLTMDLRETISPHIFGPLDDALDKVWVVVDKIIGAIKNTLMGLLGQIPFVGSDLAEHVGEAIDKLMFVIKDGVNTGLKKLINTLLDKIIGAFMLILFPKNGGFTMPFNDYVLDQAGGTATQGIASQNTAMYEMQAEKDKLEAAPAEASVVSGGEVEAAEEEEEAAVNQEVLDEAEAEDDTLEEDEDEDDW